MVNCSQCIAEGRGENEMKRKLDAMHDWFVCPVCGNWIAVPCGYNPDWEDLPRQVSRVEVLVNCVQKENGAEKQ